jgi:hypothetical protein
MTVRIILALACFLCLFIIAACEQNKMDYRDGTIYDSVNKKEAPAMVRADGDFF